MVSILVIAAFLVCGGYLLISWVIHGTGFPLDDAWIHQTYARNFSHSGEFAFVPGKLSAGSTAPLWSLLLSIGYFVKINPFFWTFVLEMACLVGIGLIGELYFRKYIKDIQSIVPIVGIFLIGEWHLAWSAVSGMETLLFALIILSVFYMIACCTPRWWLIGIILGVCIWVRPDGITLLAPGLLVILFFKKPWKAKFIDTLQMIFPALIITAMYLFFNHELSGSVFPNTFYAKQAEYAVMRQIPLLERFLSLAFLPLVGGGLLLLPGFIFTCWKAWQIRRIEIWAAILWWLGYTSLYALQLPVTYQHGRYLIPAMPIYFVLACIGFYNLWVKIKETRLIGRLLRKCWSSAIVAVWMVFLCIGALTYAQDVAIIDTEMVETAQWISANTPIHAKIGAHDIGALGYFGNRDIVDLAGLISPEVIGFIRDEKKLAQFLDDQGVDYLMSFPGWYPDLVKRGNLVYETKGNFSLQSGGENMRVYRWQR
jgi:hypothetical protein